MYTKKEGIKPSKYAKEPEGKTYEFDENIDGIYFVKDLEEMKKIENVVLVDYIEIVIDRMDD